MLDDGIPGARLVAVSSRRAEDVEGLIFAGLSPARRHAAAVSNVDLAALASLAEVVIEALPPHLFRSVAEPALAAGRTLLPLSVGALVVGNPDLFGLADRTGAEIVIPSGAIGALDLVRTAAEGGITQARLVSRKPPTALADADGRLASGERAADLRQAVRIFAGSARAAVEAYPANANVAAALAIAGLGVDRTEVEIWADPTVIRNIHRIEIEANGASFTLEVEGRPSAKTRGPARSPATASSPPSATWPGAERGTWLAGGSLSGRPNRREPCRRGPMRKAHKVCRNQRWSRPRRCP